MLLTLVSAAIVVAGILYTRQRNSPPSAEGAEKQASVACSQVQHAFADGRSHIWLVMFGRIARILPDEYGSFQHQRFIVRCKSGQTVLVTNDVSVGSRVPARPGDLVGIRGEYIWNRQGGLVHFTHSGGPAGGGWILERGKVYSLVRWPPSLPSG